ncbi:tRNA uridine-5-carboxymethylaminomethyl(34) synthesis enzyme MnmG [Candidatus Dependentiae bacterium]|nr:tRNA uridine-5-carboxymethylaminomethyl(34) synthesis enzyme MnmG [Candidatus Dependentiae bacterium]
MKNFDLIDSFDIIVIGAGHAGCEAASASAKLGMKTALITMNADSIAQMSCNPAIGGIAKGQIVCEIDALGGLMGKIIDRTGIHFKVLNKKKGAAVFSPRAQADKKSYHIEMKHKLENTDNLHIIQDTAEELIINNNKITGIVTQRKSYYKSKCVVITAGTFMNGKIHIGRENFPAGRYGEFASSGLSESLRKCGLELGRLKTGTPVRINSRTIDYSKTEIQEPDDIPVPFSYSTEKIVNIQIPCYITYTNTSTHKIIMNNIKYSPMYGDIKNITGTGVRYCPSIEDKIIKFSDKERHQLFLEKEGYLTNEVYVNGLSTSLPEVVQYKILHSISGLENSEIIRCAYAIEYDFVFPTQLRHTFETKKISGLYLAGQVNGTTGYEEAAAQGLMAGINAALKIKKKQNLIISRDEGYIGVLADDLVTKGVDEPYRMFTSRAEYRLLLRMDNADRRLNGIAYKIGMIDKEEYNKMIEKYKMIEKKITALSDINITPEIFLNSKIEQLKSNFLKKTINLKELIKRPEIGLDFIYEQCPELKELPERTVETMVYDIKYKGYIDKQVKDVKKIKKMEKMKLPENVDYHTVKAISFESAEKLNKIKPVNIGQASRITGVRQSDLAVLAIYFKSKQK